MSEGFAPFIEGLVMAAEHDAHDVKEDAGRVRQELIRFCDLHAHDISKEAYEALCDAVCHLWRIEEAEE